jgi:hypothetical protein
MTTLDPEHDAGDQAIRDALEGVRAALVQLGHSSYVGVIDHLQWALSHDRRAFYQSANGGGVWRNMGSIADFGDRQILQALVKFADALDAAHLAAVEPTLADAQVFKERLARE